MSYDDRRSPSRESEPEREAAAIPDAVAKKVENIFNDSKKALLVIVIPILAFAFIGRVIEWYLLRRKCPALLTGYTLPARSFQRARPSLWFGALFWPVIVLLIYVYVQMRSNG